MSWLSAFFNAIFGPPKTVAKPTVAAVSPTTTAATPVVSTNVGLSGEAQKAKAIYQLARDVVSRYNLNADPVMLTTMAKIESNFGGSTYRYEAHLGDASWGLMQVLTATATGLYNAGYRAMGKPNAVTLTNNTQSMYYGAAMVDNIKKFAARNGIVLTEEGIVRAYNGWFTKVNGKYQPRVNSGTTNHWNKYKAAKGSVTNWIFS